MSKTFPLVTLLLLCNVVPIAFVARNYQHVSWDTLFLLVSVTSLGFASIGVIAFTCARDLLFAIRVLTYISFAWFSYSPFFFLLSSALGDRRHAAWLATSLSVLIVVYGVFIRRSILSRKFYFVILVFSCATLISMASYLKQFPSLYALYGEHTRVSGVERELLNRPLINRPHIVYVVPDRYPSNESLKDLFDFDNREFRDFLKNFGFFVWDHQYANYTKTFQSLASTLNMGYLDPRALHLDGSDMSYVPVYRMILDSQVHRILREHDYKIVHMGNFWGPTRINPMADRNVILEGSLSEVWDAYFSLTPLAVLKSAIFTSYESQHLCDLSQKQGNALVESVAGNEPVFIFWHLFSVHEPYVKYEQGRCQSIPRSQYPNFEARKKVIVEQVKRTNGLLIDTLTRAREATKRPFVFIVQSDEGPFPQGYWADGRSYEFWNAPKSELEMKYGIFNALLLPSRNYSEFARENSPVNLFRLVFRDLFAVDLALEEHAVYAFNRDTYPYELKEITEKLH